MATEDIRNVDEAMLVISRMVKGSNDHVLLAMATAMIVQNAADPMNVIDAFEKVSKILRVIYDSRKEDAPGEKYRLGKLEELK